MAALGGVALQQKVSRLLSGKSGKPVLKSNKALALRDNVSNSNPKKREPTCITEISMMMACWKQNNFVDSLCSQETDAFYKCVAKAQADRRNQSGQSNMKRLPAKEATDLLKRYPNQRYEI